MKELIPFILFFFLFISCHKKIIEKNGDYEGDWVGFGSWKPNHFSLRIQNNSHLEYSRETSEGGDNFSGTARIGKNDIHVKVLCFKVISQPEKIDSIYVRDCNCYVHWKMELKSPKIYGGFDVTYYRE